MDRRSFLGNRQTNTGPTTGYAWTVVNPNEPQYAPMPMEEGEIDCETDQDPSILEVPAINWARYVGVKSFQYVQMGHASKIAAQRDNNWDLEQAVRETEKNFSNDLELLMSETTNDPHPAKDIGLLRTSTARTNTGRVSAAQEESCQAGSV